MWMYLINIVNLKNIRNLFIVINNFMIQMFLFMQQSFTCHQNWLINQKQIFISRRPLVTTEMNILRKVYSSYELTDLQPINKTCSQTQHTRSSMIDIGIA